jgi:ComEC/Rec2-related protein
MAGTLTNNPMLILLLPYLSGLLLGPAAPVFWALWAAARTTFFSSLTPAISSRAVAAILAAAAGVLLRSPAEPVPAGGPRLMILEGTITEGPWPSRCFRGTFLLELRLCEHSAFACARGSLAVVAEGYPDSALEPGARVRFPGEITLRHGEIRIRTRGRLITLINRAPLLSLPRFLYRIRRSLKACLDRSLPQRTAPVCASVLLGIPGAVGFGTKDLFRQTGTVHLLAISGLHVGVVILALSRILSLFTAPGWRRESCQIGALAVLCLLTGGRTPVVRASIAGALHILSTRCGRASSSTAFLANAAFFILLFDPAACRAVSFQLSFAGYAAILLCLKRIPAERKTRLPLRFGKVVQAATISLAAWCGTAPLAARYFGRIVPFAPLVNIAAIPLFSVTLCAALVHLLIALPFPGAAEKTAVVVDLLFRALFQLLEWAAALLPGPVETGQPPVAVLFIFYGIAAAGLFAPAPRRKKGG